MENVNPPQDHPDTDAQYHFHQVGVFQVGSLKILA